MASPPPPTSGFRKLGVVGASNKETNCLKGTRLSLHSTLQQTSTGIQSLDLLLGNGINVSSSLLLQVSTQEVSTESLIYFEMQMFVMSVI